jgi:hypothetical protein
VCSAEAKIVALAPIRVFVKQESKVRGGLVRRFDLEQHGTSLANPGAASTSLSLEAAEAECLPTPWFYQTSARSLRFVLANPGMPANC